MLRKKSQIVAILLYLVSTLFISCTSFKLTNSGWTVKPDIKSETFTILHKDLGAILTDAHLYIKNGKNLIPLKNWKVSKEDNSLKILASSSSKETTWKIQILKDKVKIECSDEAGLIRGSVAAQEDRIPARMENQDNGIMYTSLGLVSALNIHNLFDIKTDIMIQFPEDARLRRNPEDNRIMDLTMVVANGREISLIFDYYITRLGLKYYKPKPDRFRTAPTGWCSWYCYYMGTTEKDMIEETDALAKHLKPFGLEYVQLDACYTRGEDANYLEWNKKAFPRGGKWLFQYIKGKGLKPGLWVNIYGSNYAKAECADKYPENYYLRDKNGKLSGACCTADETVVRLDYTNPDVIENHLKPMFRIFKDQWGLEYLKDAGWGTWMDYYEANRSNAYDSTQSSRDVYVNAQKALRETLGDDVFINGCAMHEVGLCFGIFDGSRIGGDDKATWYPEHKRGMSMQTFFNSLFGGNYLNNIVWFSDPDVVMVRNPLTIEEAKTIVTSIALTGQLYMASDFMARLPEKRLKLYQKTMPTTPIVPIDLYPYKIKNNKRNGVVWCCPQLKEYPKAIDLKVNAISGSYDVVALFNWNDRYSTKSINIEELGLNKRNSYLAFDFWDQRLKQITNEQIKVKIPPHGTKVYIIRQLLKRPQLIATSRHITCAVSIKNLEWNSEKAILNGNSEIIEKSPYSIFIHVPEGWKLTNIESDIEYLFHRIKDQILEVKFSGDLTFEGQTSFNWSISFEKNS